MTFVLQSLAERFVLIHSRDVILTQFSLYMHARGPKGGYSGPV